MKIELKYEVGQRVFHKEQDKYRVDTIRTFQVINKNGGPSVEYLLDTGSKWYLETELYSDAKEFYKKHSERLKLKHKEELGQLKEILKLK